MHTSTWRLVTALTLILLAACTTPTMQDQPSTEFAPAELYPVTNTGFAEAFVARDARLSGYRRLHVLPLDTAAIDIPQTLVMGTTRGDWLMTPEREQALQQAWAEAMDEAFSSYQRATTGAGVLRIAAKITRIEPGRPTTTTIGGGLAGDSSRDVVEVSIEIRLYAQDSDALLAVIRDSRTMTAVAMARTAPVGIVEMFRSWTALLHTRITGE